MSNGVAIHLSGTVGTTKDDVIKLVRKRDGLRLFLEIDAPGAGSALGSEADALVRRELQAVVTEIQSLIDSPSGLPIRRDR